MLRALKHSRKAKETMAQLQLPRLQALSYSVSLKGRRLNWMLFGRNSRTRLMATIIAWPADTSLVSCCVTMSTVNLAGTKEIIIRGR